MKCYLFWLYPQLERMDNNGQMSKIEYCDLKIWGALQYRTRHYKTLQDLESARLGGKTFISLWWHLAARWQWAKNGARYIHTSYHVISWAWFPVSRTSCHVARHPLWRHQMKAIFRVTGPLWGESTGHRSPMDSRWIDAELWCFLWSAHEQSLSKQSIRQWCETPSSSLWCHCNVFAARLTSASFILMPRKC